MPDREAGFGTDFARGYSVENPDGADIVALFTSILYDPAAVQFVDGFAFSIFGQVHPELFSSPTISLQPILDPEPHVVSPADTLFGLITIRRGPLAISSWEQRRPAPNSHWPSPSKSSMPIG